MTRENTTTAVPDVLRQAGTLVQFVRLLDQQLRVSSVPHPLALAELSVLGQVDRGVDLPSQVARVLRKDRARITHLVDRLVSLGLLTRTVDANDRRCWRLQVTAQGAQALADGRARMRAVMETVLDGLDADERDGLLHGLSGVRRVLDAMPEGAS